MSGLSSADSTPVKKPQGQRKASVKWSKKLFSEDEDDTLVKQKGNRKYVDQDSVDNMETESVTKVPPIPNGNIKYEVKYDHKQPLSNVCDRWNWDRAQPCKRNGFCKGGRRTLQLCRGSLECVNIKCPYMKIHKSSNKVDFSRAKKCQHCKEEPLKVDCTARKYVENDRCHQKMTVIYIGEHSCSPRAEEKKPEREEVENIIRQRPTITTQQIQIEKVRESLLNGCDSEAIEDVALKYSNSKHLRYIHSKVNEKARPGGSDIEAIRILKEDFQKRNLDENLIMEVGQDFVILSSEQKLRVAALITLGQINEPVSLDGCESHVKDFTEIEMTTYYPLLRRNVKLVSMFVPKPGENSDNVSKMIKTFDEAVNQVLPSVARELDLDPDEFRGKGLDAHAYVGDEGGALWSGLCKAKGGAIKNSTVSDFFHIKQDIHRHLKYFKTEKDQKRFHKLMQDAYDATTSIQAEDVERSLDNLIKRSTNPKKMNNFKTWWWRRRIRWQKWCRTYSSSSASSAEVANAKSVSASGYRKRLLDVVTTECSAAILEAAEIKRQVLGQRTVGQGPTAAERNEKENSDLYANIDACASAVQYIAENAMEMEGREEENVESAQNEYRVNTRDTHRSDRHKNPRKSKQNCDSQTQVNKKSLRFFEKNVEGVTMDILECKTTMEQFTFKILDTMGYQEKVTITKNSADCSSPRCRKPNCHHLLWVLHNVFNFSKNQPLVYKRKFTQDEWQQIIEAYPDRVALARLPVVKNQTYKVSRRVSKKEAKCAVCKRQMKTGELQVSTEGAYRTIHRVWIIRTFYFCPSMACITKMPRNSYIIPFNPSTMSLQYDPGVTEEEKRSINLT